MPGLAECVAEIRDAIGDAIEGAATSGDILEDVEGVVRGRRARPMPGLPAIWVIAEPAVFEQDVYGQSEAWRLPFSLAALVKSDEPEEGEAQCVQLAALAKRAAMREPLGLDYVIDVRPLSFDPMARPDEGSRNLYWAHARIQVWFTAEEDDS